MAGKIIRWEDDFGRRLKVGILVSIYTRVQKNEM